MSTSVNDANQIVIVGNPNCGKTSLFNAITGESKLVGNWAGVTVDVGFGNLLLQETATTVVDLPGIYSLVATHDATLDEEATTKYLHQYPNAVCINVIDANNITKDLYLTQQLLESGFKVIVVVNFLYGANQNGLTLSLKELEQQLQCPVLAISSPKHSGLTNLDALTNLLTKIITTDKDIAIKTPISITTTQEQLPISLHELWLKCCTVLTPGKAVRALEGDILLQQELLTQNIDLNKLLKSNVLVDCDDIDLIFAVWRKNKIVTIVSAVESKFNSLNINWGAWLDKILLDKFLGIPLFLFIMYLTFTSALKIGGYFQEYCEQYLNVFLMQQTDSLLTLLHTNAWIKKILLNGFLEGVCITLTFVPLLAIIYFLLGVLEHSGYMARAAFIVDKLMQLLGLPGKAFIPMIVGFGCNVPAVMGARTISTYYQRVMTIIMTPFMSCSARLAIYVIFAAAFFPKNGHNVIFSLYLIGIVVAILTALLLKKSLYTHKQDSSIIELPRYKFPVVTDILVHTKRRLMRFTIKTGVLIVPICTLLSVVDTGMIEQVGKFVTPLFSPMGITTDNWQATVGLMTGLFAKETMIATLNTLYSNYTEVGQELSIIAKANMVQAFGSYQAAYAYLLFTLLYFPCISVIAAIGRELNMRWAMFSVFWSTGMGYSIAVIYYQCSIGNYYILLYPSVIIALFLGLNKWYQANQKYNNERFRTIAIPTKVVLN